MALIHYLFVGHFVPYDGFIKFDQMRPVCAGPLDQTVLSELFEERFGKGATADQAPADWHMTVYPDHIICDRHGSSTAALEFVSEYAKRAGGQIVDLGSFMLIAPDTLLGEARKADTPPRGVPPGA